MHKSVSTIDSPEFINLQPLDLNPLMSSCEIKVLYIGENRNHSYISKQVATEMAKTLRGAPIVGYYKQSTQDFGDHGHKVVIDDEGIKFECQTVPYGFVAPDAKVWFKKFDDQDDFGNSVTREYLMTTGYLWTGQFEECKRAIDVGNNQSMELDEKSLDGHWSTNSKNNMDFFIINDATFSKLCILGENVEPCFEGARVTAPDVSKNFSLDDNFKNTLFSMMQDLRNVAEQGGISMNEFENNEEVVTETEQVEEETVVENTENDTDPSTTSDFKKNDEEEEDKQDDASDEDKADDSSNDDEDKKDDEEQDKKKKYSLLEENFNKLQNDFNELQTKFSALEVEANELRNFKTEIDNAKKDELINKFYMLSDEDKKDVIENKSKYSYDEIEAKLSVALVRSGINFNLNNENNDDTDEEKHEDPITTFNLDDDAAYVPAFVSALRNTQKNRV